MHDPHHLSQDSPAPDERGFWACGARGLSAGLLTSWSLLKVMVPSILAVQFLKATGILDRLADFAAPAMKLFGLPGEASLALLTGALVNIYACIAVAVNIPMTVKSMTVLAIMVLIAHNLIVETAVQSRAGTPAGVMLTVRLSAAAIAGLAFNALLPARYAQADLSLPGAAAQSGDLSVIIFANLFSLLRVVGIVVVIMVLTAYLREYGLLDRLVDGLHHPMRILGLEKRTSFVAAVGLVLGIAYGAGLIVEESRRSAFTPREILATNLLLGTTHALIEDTLIFFAVGANLLWILIGRILFGALFLRLALPVAGRFVGKEKGQD